MRVLYVNHTAEVSGAEHSLLSLLAGLPGEVRPVVAAPRGRLTDACRGLGVQTTAILGTAGSLRLHLLHTPRALGEMALAAAQVRRAARRLDVDVVHANSIRAGIVLALARIPQAATVVHVRDCLPPGPVTTTTLRLIAASTDTVVANSQYTATAVRTVAPGARLAVAHNPVDLERWDPARVDRARARARLGFADERLLLGVVAQLSPWKGQDVAVAALRLARDMGLDAHLLLIGSAKFVARATRFDNQVYVASLRAQIAEAGLEDRVRWLGERDDVPELVGALDALLLPSWEEPFGRALIEAMALGVPVLATNVGGPPEILSDGREGYLLPPRDPPAWAQAIAALAGDHERARNMGRAGRRRVEQAFTAAHHVAVMREVYERALRARGRAAVRSGQRGS